MSQGFHRTQSTQRVFVSGGKVDREGIGSFCMWEMVGGQFNGAETAHLGATPGGGRSQEIIADADIVRHLRNGEVEAAKTKAHDRFVEGMRANGCVLHTQSLILL